MVTSKTCFRCKVEKPIDEFYRGLKMADGHVGKCKECTKDDVRKNYMKNREHYMAYEKARGASPRRRRQCAKNFAKYRSKHRDRMNATNAVYRAIKRGQLVRPDKCSRCARTIRVEGHHHDYSKPLVVEWLCRSCHRLEHSK